MKRIYHEREAPMIYSQMTDRQHSRNDKSACVSFRCFQVSRHYMKRNPAKKFDCNRGIYMYFMSFGREKTTFHGQTLGNVREMKADVTKQIKLTSR